MEQVNCLSKTDMKHLIRFQHPNRSSFAGLLMRQSAQKYYARYDGNKCYRDFLAIRRFIKCNFGLYDNMIDIDENWNFKFEFVGCPLRGECDGFKKICEPKFNSTLSDSQLRVMELCYYGKKDEEIAEALFISSHTVKNHRKNVFRKLSIHSMAEFMRYANEKNLFKSE